MDIRIVVLQRGWVLVGEYHRPNSSLVTKLTRVRNVRRWGTQRGLAQLANEGPIQGKTVLDDGADAEWHVLAEVMSLKCNESAWAKHLGPGGTR